MRKLTNDIRFVTMEDIVGNPQQKNYVVYNPVLALPRRTMLFQAYMAKKYDHVFTVSELDYLMAFDEFHLTEFIAAVKNIIHKDSSQ